MSVKDLTKSGPVILTLLIVTVLAVPFGIEKVGETTDLFKLPVTKWVKGLFASKPAAGAPKTMVQVKWEERLADLKAFSDWADGRAEAQIKIVRPDEFQIEKADQDPVTASRCSWNLLSLSDKTDVNATQIRQKLSLIFDPADKVSGRIESVKPLSDGRRGFVVTVSDIRGEGRMGLVYGNGVPAYYNLKLRRMWLVPVASCRSAMKDRYEAAVFFPGVEKGLPEGAIISPGSDKCGYKVLSISDRCVWLEAFYGSEPSAEVLPNGNWPDFSRIDTLAPTPPPGRLIFGRNRCFWPGDAIKLPNSGIYLMVDDFLAGRAVVFRLLDAEMRPVRELLCVIVREKQ